MSKKWIMGLLFAALLALAACGNDEEAKKEGQDKDQKQEQKAEQGKEGGEGEQAKMPEPDLKDTPEVVAEVNGEEIKKEEFESAYKQQFQQAALQAQMSGQELNQDQLKKQMVESLVGQELLIQEANNRGYEATQEEKDKILEDLAEQNQLGSKDEFMAALEEQGMSKEEIDSQLELQVKMDQLIAEEAGDLEPSEEELKQAYEQMKAQQEQMGGEGQGEVPPYEEVKPQLEEQVKMQKEGEEAQKLMKSLREDADVKVHI
ncbi:MULTISPECIES: SurA N-terminal domain-containing protein [Thalassobacillus]|uniref:SurA N-terminal domain-containing protein n=1 Tax=Thalassobacillus TaxID=331971 RepID=UPI0020CAA1AB|nr:SurA N-terminal domain-containing protein [Thalassobacillus devorans]